MKEIIKLNAINQIGIVAQNAVATAKLLETTFGIGPFQILERPPEEIIYKGEKQTFQITNALAFLGRIQIEIIQVIKGECCQAEFLRRTGGGLHHIGIYVDDLDVELQKAKNLGIEVLQTGTAVGAIRWAYLDTEKKYGIIIELIQLGKKKKKN
ncbi:MAG: VOC family protein [Candidatus Helarchaeota archaeon]